MDNYLSKITVKAIGCDPKACIKAEKTIDLAKIYGVVNESKPVDGMKDGKLSYQFFGNFEAINLQTGEVFQSTKLFLPKVVEDLLETTLRPTGKEKLESVRFAFQIAATPGESPVGYIFKAANLMKLQENDPLAAMREELAAASKPAPAVPATQAQAPAAVMDHKTTPQQGKPAPAPAKK